MAKWCDWCQEDDLQAYLCEVWDDDGRTTSPMWLCDLCIEAFDEEVRDVDYYRVRSLQAHYSR